MAKTITAAATCLFNVVLCFNYEKIEVLGEELIHTIRAIDEVLSNQQDEEALHSVLLCECRVLYGNHIVTTFVEDKFKNEFSETHTQLKNK